MKRDTIFNREILSLLSPLPLFFFRSEEAIQSILPSSTRFLFFIAANLSASVPLPIPPPFALLLLPPRNQTDKVVLKYSKFRRRGRGEEEEDPGTRAKKWRDRLAFNMRQSSTLTFPV